MFGAFDLSRMGLHIGRRHKLPNSSSRRDEIMVEYVRNVIYCVPNGTLRDGLIRFSTDMTSLTGQKMANPVKACCWSRQSILLNLSKHVA